MGEARRRARAFADPEGIAAPVSGARRLRELLAGDELIVAPGVYDGVSAALVAKLGFDAA